MNAPDRYPGTRPFVGEQSALFFGRQQEILDLAQLLEFQQLVVLYSKSGLGKSSLINAGLLPFLRGERVPEGGAGPDTGYEVAAVRLHARRDAHSPLPLETVRATLSTMAAPALDDLIPEEGSLWYHAKNWQLAHPGRTLLLVFDQFEELFTYPEAAVQTLRDEMAELLRPQIPQRFLRILAAMKARGSRLATEALEEALYQPLTVKVLLAIRSDYHHLLNRLSSHLPEVLRNNYELLALTPNAARQAIVLPAGQSGDYATPAFDYTKAALDNMLDFLRDEETGLVEAIQLQIICQSLEERVQTEGLRRIEALQVADLDETVAEFYRKRLQSLPDDQALQRAARLIEEGLIKEENRQRLPLFESQIGSLFQVDAALLKELVDRHLLRRDVDQRGGVFYELSHDTLVAPALAAKQQRLERERAAAEAERQQALEQAQREAREERARRQREEDLRRQAETSRSKAEEEATRVRRLSRWLMGLAIILGAFLVGVAFLANMLRQKNMELTKTSELLEESKNSLDTINSELASKNRDLEKSNQELYDKTRLSLRMARDNYETQIAAARSKLELGLLDEAELDLQAAALSNLIYTATWDSQVAKDLSRNLDTGQATVLQKQILEQRMLTDRLDEVERLLNEGLQLESLGSIEWPAGYLNARQYYQAARRELEGLDQSSGSQRLEELDDEVDDRIEEVQEKLDLSLNHFLERAEIFAKEPVEGCREGQRFLNVARQIDSQDPRITELEKRCRQ